MLTKRKLLIDQNVFAIPNWDLGGVNLNSGWSKLNLTQQNLSVNGHYNILKDVLYLMLFKNVFEVNLHR